jgi:Immunity protein 72
MALFDFLKSRWSAGKMTEEDRARRFWALKSFTSFTAWKRCRDRYAVFVALMELQCKEEPIGRLGPTEFAKYKAKVEQWVRDGEFPARALDNLEDDHRTDWDSGTYARVLEGLSQYDRGLAQLGKGDRGVFLHNSRGLLEDAVDSANHEYEIYYMGGPKGGDGMVFYGKYVPAMKAALLWATEHGSFNAGGLQPAMAELSAPSVWTEPRDVPGPNGGKMHMPGSHVALMEATAHVKDLPRVPAPTQDVLVQTGEPCPVFGIYEPQVRDGMMAYMCQGQEAYRYGEPCSAPRAGAAVAWKLIWEDRRYRDGAIPDEEKHYFPEDNTPPDFTRLVGVELANDWRSDQLVVQRSGESARYTGTWVAQDDLHGRVFWRQGDPLPPHKGMSVDWVYSGV